MNRRGELLCAWTGPLCVVMFFVAWVAFADWMPPPRPSMSAEQIAAMYQARTVLIRAGMMLMMYSGPLYGIFSAIILFLIIPAQIYGTTAFRPDRAVEITYFGNDLGWFMFDMVNSTLITQYLALGIAVFFDDADRPVFPRWFAFFNFWSALTLIPAGLITFFKTGPFSWAGILGFYLGVVVFTVWCFVTFWQLLRAIKRPSIYLGNVCVR